MYNVHSLVCFLWHCGGQFASQFDFEAVAVYSITPVLMLWIPSHFRCACMCACVHWTVCKYSFFFSVVHWSLTILYDSLQSCQDLNVTDGLQTTKDRSKMVRINPSSWGLIRKVVLFQKILTPVAHSIIKIRTQIRTLSCLACHYRFLSLFFLLSGTFWRSGFFCLCKFLLSCLKNLVNDVFLTCI